MKPSLLAPLLLSLSLLLYGQDPNVPPGSKIFIAKMEGGLDGFIPPEIRRQKVPLTVVLDDKTRITC